MQIPTQPAIIKKGKRFVERKGKQVEVGLNAVSKDSAEMVVGDYRIIVAKFPRQPKHLEKACRIWQAKLVRKLELMTAAEKSKFWSEPPLDFVSDEEKGEKKLNKYWIKCTACEDVVGYCWAKNEKLEGWCDLHYISYHDEIAWRGALTVSVSRTDGHLGIECACGEDTRDHRDGSTLPPQARRLMTNYTMAHREFGKETSSFRAEETNDG